MKKSKINFSNPIKFIITALPFVLSVTGHMLAGKSLSDALYISPGIYAMKAPSPSPNIVLEIARWIGVLITASWALFIGSTIWSGINNFIRYRRGNSIAVYGPEKARKAMLDKLQDRGIEIKEKLVKADQYILLGSEDENLDFYEQNRSAIKNKPVYLKCSTLPIQSSADPDLILFCPEETAARQYWKERNLIDLSFKNGHELKIVFIGFGRLGKELLNFGLQDNIFSPKQKIEYHIYGKSDGYFETHTQLSSIEDSIIFHKEPWYEDLLLIESADRLIVLTQNDQLALIQELMLSTIRNEIDVFCASNTGIDLLDGKERLKIYMWKDEADNPENIFSDKLYERAKKLNLRYAHLYSDVEETEENKQSEWQKLDTFTRYSNISSADYHEIRLKMLEYLNKSADECLELLSELEHMRWCRYHYLNNWKYGILENENAKDAANKIHIDLLPYNELTDAEKQKDRDSINVLMSVL